MEPTRFNGSEAARRWIYGLRYTSIANLQDNKLWIERVDALLIGEAADWADTHSEVQSILALAASSDFDKQSYIELLKQRFSGNAKPPSTFNELQAQLENLKQNDIEILKKYYEHTYCLLYRMRVTDHTLNSTSNIIESLVLSQVITRFAEGIYDSRLRFKILTEYVDVNVDTKSLRGAYEVSEHQLRVMKAKNLRQKEEDERIEQARNEAITNIMRGFIAKGMSLQAAVDATAAWFYTNNAHDTQTSMPTPNKYARTSDLTPRTPHLASYSASTSYSSYDSAMMPKYENATAHMTPSASGLTSSNPASERTSASAFLTPNLGYDMASAWSSPSASVQTSDSAFSLASDSIDIGPSIGLVDSASGTSDLASDSACKHPPTSASSAYNLTCDSASALPATSAAVQISGPAALATHRLATYMPRVNDVSYASDPTPTLLPVGDLFQDDADSASTVETQDHNLEPIEEILASGPCMTATPTPTADIITPTAETLDIGVYVREQVLSPCLIEEDFIEEDYEEEIYVGEQAASPCSMSYELPPLPPMDTSLDVDFSTFDIEYMVETMDTKPPVESHVISMPRKKLNLSPFKGLGLRSNSTSWARASRPPNVVIRNTNIATPTVRVDANTDVDVREQVLSPCPTVDSMFYDTDLYVREQAPLPCLNVDVIMTSKDTIRKPSMKDIRNSVAPHLRLFLATFTTMIWAMLLPTMHQSFMLLLANRRPSMDTKHNGRPKVKIKQFIDVGVLHHRSGIQRVYEDFSIRYIIWLTTLMRQSSTSGQFL